MPQRAVVQRGWLGLVAILILTAGWTPTARAEPEGLPAEVQFNRDVRPILSNACFTCHGPDSQTREADQRFDTEEGLRALRESGAIVPGKPAASEMLVRITTNDPELRMPPPGHPHQLTAREIEVLRRWIAQGAAWQPHWSLIAPQRPKLPEAAGGSEHPIDRFLSARLRTEGLKPAEPADPGTLLRRLSLDLTGLPPGLEELERYLADSSHEAYEREVDRLLASPRYGERMALYWLDLVRYADSVGYHKDTHQDVWLYRDYVISAFNANKPYDRFVVEQLAGDLLRGTPFQEFEWRIASGFNRMNQTTSEGGAQAKEYLAKYAADRVRNTGAIFLGLTTGCAECHDHKFDPITAEDFYNFAAFFADVKEAGVGQPAATPMPTLTAIRDGRLKEMELERLREQLEAGAAELPEGKTLESLQQRAAALEKELAEAADPQANEKEFFPTLITIAAKPRPIRLLPRGNWLDDSGPLAAPAAPRGLGALPPGETPATRLDLAHWIIDRENPLTARVFVNRVWKLLFGEGISRTVDDVGSQGEWPSHPELLDWLAIEFVESGWDVKRLVRLIVTSEAYRRSSVPTDELQQRDPENRLFARQNRFRLPAELVRDNALAVSGLLSDKMYGRSVRPYQPANYWSRMYSQGKYVQDHGEDLYRRGLYTYWRRSFWHPSLALFDAPSREECVARRPRSNTPQQALALLNDPTYVEAARVLAERLLREGGSEPAARIDWLFRRVLARSAEDWETEALVQLHDRQFQRYTAEEAAARRLIANGEFPVPEDLPPVELAAWMSVSRAVLNLHETITRN